MEEKFAEGRQNNPEQKKSSTKDKILSMLTLQKGNQVSGQEIAEKLNVSRAAVWKAVATLREQGFDIQASTNGGYLLAQGSAKNNDIFSKEIFDSLLSKTFPQYSACHTEIFTTIDSTNSYATRTLSSAAALRNSQGELTESGKKLHKAIIVAESQSAGRGRMGRSFYSPNRTGIYLSIIYCPKGGIKEPAKITAISAVGVCRAIEKLYGVEAKIKWVNDIFINGKKACGILTEGFTNFETGIIESAVIGIGINIEKDEKTMPEELRDIIGSISEGSYGGTCAGEDNFSQRENCAGEDNFPQKENCAGEDNFPRRENCAGGNISRAELAAQVAGEVLQVLEGNPGIIINEYRKRSCLLGKIITVSPIIDEEKSKYQAKAIDIDENANLVVELADGSVRHLSSGEVTLHGN